MSADVKDLQARYDVVIVGGGVIGSAVAYFLAADADFDGSVLVVEPDPSYADSSTARSAGSIRQQFSTAENIEMSAFGMRFVKTAAEQLSVDGEAPALGLVENGYLFLASEGGRAVMLKNHALQSTHGAQVALMDPAALSARFSWINTDGIVLGALGLRDEGWIDPYALLQAFRRKARSLGAVYAADRLVDIESGGRRLTAVRLADAGRVAAGAVVNAAGPRAAEIAAMAGIELPVRPRKRVVYVFDCRAALPDDFPLLIDTNGVYVRPESGHYICGVAPPEDDDPDCLDLEPIYEPFEETVWPSLAHRVPAFEAIKLIRAWAGHYAYNTFDHNAIIGPHPTLANLYFANGFSGHGLQQAPAVGRALAELIVHGGFRSIDLSRMGYDRIARNAPVLELNVV